ncbi:MAG: hypothetical protein HKM07_04195 [Chlamydiae bacterium]|nr:hypothetical protein [Chlamydiota bacterium]
MAFQLGIWLVLFCLRSLHVQNINLIAVILFGVFLLSRIRNFNFRRNLDVRMTQITLEGLKLEQRNLRRESFFQEVLRQFGIIKIMLLRCVVDLMALYFFVIAAYHLTLDYNPILAADIEHFYKTFYPALGIIGFLVGGLYYNPLKAFIKAKKGVFQYE